MRSNTGVPWLRSISDLEAGWVVLRLMELRCLTHGVTPLVYDCHRGGRQDYGYGFAVYTISQRYSQAMSLPSNATCPPPGKSGCRKNHSKSIGSKLKAYLSFASNSQEWGTERDSFQLGKKVRVGDLFSLQVKVWDYFLQR